MKMKPDELLELLNTIDRLGYRRFRLEQDGLLLEVDRDGGGAVQDSAPAPDTASGAVAPVARAPEPSAPAGSTIDAAPSDRTGLVPVSAPMTGTFYAAPEPDAPPFVAPGSEVGAEDTVCIIEVMKLFNSIPAGTAGTVVEIAVTNEATVSVGDPLLWIRPQ